MAGLSENKPKNSLAKVFARFGSHFSRTCDVAAVSRELEKHPFPDSLLAITEIAESFDVNVVAYKLNAEHLNKLPLPFLTQLTYRGLQVVLIEKFDENQVVYFDGFQRFKIPVANFIKHYTGKVVFSTDQATTKRSFFVARMAANIFSPKNLYAPSVLLFLFTIYWLTGINVLLFILTAPLFWILTGGLVISILLLTQSINGTSDIVRKICSISNDGCFSILTSDSAKIFSWLSWSEIGFFYFCSTWLFLLITGRSVSSLHLLALLNLCCLPYTIYSISYQAFVARKWCILCCAVQITLWIEFIVSGIPNLSLAIRPADIYTILTVCALVVSSWYMIKSFLINHYRLSHRSKEWQTLKFNEATFKAVMQMMPKFKSPDENISMVLGSENPDVIITIVSGPYCDACAKFHGEIENFLKIQKTVQIRLIFWGVYNEQGPQNTIIHYLNSFYEHSPALISKAIDAWYEHSKMNLKSWKTLFTISLSDSALITIEKQRIWCDIAGIVGTPAVFVDGFLLPEYYSLSDLKYINLQIANKEHVLG